MKDTIIELEIEKKLLRTRIDNIDSAIESFRKVCKHTDNDGNDLMEYVGHDSHKDYYKCSICGESRSV
jgi:hypothetical protein